jgi:hypothetical protein
MKLLRILDKLFADRDLVSRYRGFTIYYETHPVRAGCVVFPIVDHRILLVEYSLLQMTTRN